MKPCLPDPCRRYLLLGSSALPLMASLPGTGRAEVPARQAPLNEEERAHHALKRLAYGPRPQDVQDMQRLGAARWLEGFLQAQLQPQALPATLEQRLAGLGTWRESQGELGERFRRAQQAQRENKAAKTGSSPADPAPNARRELVRPVLLEAQSQRLWRALESPAQLQERLVEFWFNHFNVYAGKSAVSVYAGAYEREAIRPHILGRFRDMLGATARHPAMLIYLDNHLSVAPGFQPRRANARSQGLNENYARELMELHTLGVDGGYTQADVTELARMLTGWTLDLRGLGSSRDLFAFDPRRHDHGEKLWLGRRIRASGPREGQAEGEQALDILARHPATARHLSRKLAQCFVADEPPASLVDRLAQVFLRSDGDLRQWTEALIQAPEFWSPEHWQAQFKTPYRYLLSALRAVNAQVDEPALLLPLLAQAGQPLYGWQTPDGYKTTAAAWRGPEALTQRVQFASSLAEGRLGRRWNADTQPQALLATLGPSLQARTRAALLGETPAAQAALLLASPDFMQC
ncbi:DUF1800 domain-containing protein [Roseateles sp. DB2]|uniref:DUF1800 domain-containing protein n=1 Tax=Roseateles sp. DB2 TaxID=3453717 RepID=UPI003EEC0413